MKLKSKIAKWLVKLAQKLDITCVPVEQYKVMNLPISSDHIKLIQVDMAFSPRDIAFLGKDEVYRQAIRDAKYRLSDAIANSDMVSWLISNTPEYMEHHIRARLYVTDYAQVMDREIKDRFYTVIDPYTLKKNELV